MKMRLESVLRMPLKKMVALTLGDLRNIWRDPMLLPVLFVPMVLLMVWRFAIPLVAEILQAKMGFDLRPHYPFIVSFGIMTTPLTLGMLAGFMILDERDEDILTYFAVTPLSKSGYLFFRIMSAVLMSGIFAWLMVGFTGLIEPEYWRLAPFLILTALQAPMLALFMGAFAGNKVEGLALGKGAGFIFIAPVIGYLVPSQWQLLAGILPTYWVSKGVVDIYTQGGGYWWWLLGGVIVHGLILWFFLRRFEARIN